MGNWKLFKFEENWKISPFSFWNLHFNVLWWEKWEKWELQKTQLFIFKLNLNVFLYYLACFHHSIQFRKGFKQFLITWNSERRQNKKNIIWNSGKFWKIHCLKTLSFKFFITVFKNLEILHNLHGKLYKREKREVIVSLS